MQPEFWHKRWERGEIGWHQGEINAHLRELWPTLSLPRGSRILVPLCGKSLDLLWLASQGHRVLGVEISQVAVEAFFSENGLTPSIAAVPAGTSYRVDEIEILCGDFFALDPEQLGEIGAVYDRAALIAFPPEVRAAYSGRLDRLLPRSVPRLLIVLEYDQSQMAGPPFAVFPDEVETLFSARHRVTALAELDVLADWPQTRTRGLASMLERVYRLDPK